MQMILIPEEISKIREELRREEEVLNRGEISLNTDNYRIKKDLLYKSEFLKERITDYIDIGTKFTIKLFGQKEKDVFLVEEDLDYSNEENKNIFLSKSSDLGSLVVGKKEGDLVERILENGNKIVIGTIDKIQKDGYLELIRTRKKYTRESREARKKSAEQLSKRKKQVTQSQVNLLKEEILYLLNHSLNYQEKRRLTEIRKLLKEVEVVTPPTDDTIGIGSEFSLTLANAKGLKTIRVEMIQEALGRELPDEYIEQISPAGGRILGLKEGESFEYISSKEGKVDGFVFDIDNEKKDPKTSNPLYYHIKTMEKGGLVEGQIEMLQQELELQKKTLERHLNERKKQGYEVRNNQEIDKARSRISEISRLLTEKKKIENPNSDTINIGSKFTLLMIYNDKSSEELNATLVEKFVSHEARSEEFISMEKEIGRAIYGKQMGDFFHYLAPTGALVTGKVLEIKKTDITEKKPIQKSNC